MDGIGLFDREHKLRSTKDLTALSSTLVRKSSWRKAMTLLQEISAAKLLPDSISINACAAACALEFFVTNFGSSYQSCAKTSSQNLLYLRPFQKSLNVVVVEISSTVAPSHKRAPSGSKNHPKLLAV